MKTLIALILISTSFAQAEEKVPVTKAFQQKICQLVVKEAAKSSYDIPEYTMKECLQNASIDIYQEYQPTPQHPEIYEIHFNDFPAALEETEQWIACEFKIEGKLDAKKIEIDWCSVEG